MYLETYPSIAVSQSLSPNVADHRLIIVRVPPAFIISATEQGNVFFKEADENTALAHIITQNAVTENVLVMKKTSEALEVVSPDLTS